MKNKIAFTNTLANIYQATCNKASNEKDI